MNGGNLVLYQANIGCLSIILRVDGGQGNRVRQGIAANTTAELMQQEGCAGRMHIRSEFPPISNG